VLVAAAAALLAVAAGGCGARAGTADVVNGKAVFVQRCGSCHVLERAGTAGKTGPNLDQAFGPSRRDGLGSKTIAGVVRDQILYPGRNSPMPAKIVTGEDAREVAAYVGMVAGLPGKDQGALATAGLAGATDGKQIFTAAGCGGCHTLSAAAASGNIGPNLNDLAKSAPKLKPGTPPAQYVEESIVKPNAFIAPGYQAGVMPQSYGSQLTPQQVKAVSDFILKSGGG
jgi:mono/diheme cytochrome c family protein